MRRANVVAFLAGVGVGLAIGLATPLVVVLVDYLKHGAWIG